MMVPSKSLAIVGMAVLASAAGAQQQHSFKPVNGAPKNAQMNWATKEITRGGGSQQATAAVYCNTDTSGFYSTSGNAGFLDEWLDWGVIPGSGLVSQTQVVDCYSFGYGTNALDTTMGGPGASLQTIFYTGTTGFGNMGMFAGGFQFSGLPGDDGVPGASGWLIGVNLVGGFEFCLPDGPFGYGFVFGDVDTGPLLVFAGDGAGGPDGNGDYDAFDWYQPAGAGYLGTFFFGGPPYDFSSWYLKVKEEDGTCGVASAVFRNGGTNLANLISTAPVYKGSVTVTIAPKAGGTFSFILGYGGGPFNFAIGIGTILCNILDPSGELLGQGPMVNAGVPAVWTLPTPLDLSLCGLAICIQGVQFGGGATLTNAFDTVIGF